MVAEGMYYSGEGFDVMADLVSYIFDARDIGRRQMVIRLSSQYR